MAELRTQKNDASVADFINAFADSEQKFTRGKGCIYVKKLSDINQDELKKIMKATIDFLQAKHK